MPKKTVAARGGAQRNRPRVRAQKSIELVRQPSDERGQEQETVSDAEPTAVSVSTVEAPEVKESRSKNKSSVTRETRQSESTNSDTGVAAAPKGSAAARLAARRQASQRAQQRNAATLITAEHYTYVRKDLVFIAILAAIMFSAIIILHFVPGIGS
jgi:hypothetical protein